MVNKLALVILLVIMAAAMVIGGLVGLQLGGGGLGALLGGDGADGASTPPPATPTPSATPTATPTPSPTPAPTPTSTPVPTIAASQFDERTIAAEIVTLVNQRRAEQGAGTLEQRSALTELAQFHSGNMAAQGYASHTALGYSAPERYERFGLTCQVSDDSGTELREGADLETVARTLAGIPYETDSSTRTNSDESDVARAVFEQWVADDTALETLTLEAAKEVGVGVSITDTGRVYVTLNLC